MFTPRIFLACALLFSAGTPIIFAEEKPRQQTVAPAAITELPEAGIPETFLQGAPVEHWEKDKVYIFEFWATWCGPCLASVPHIETLHKYITRENLPIQIIGVNIRDRVKPEKLLNFLSRLDTPPSYTIAVDTDKRTDKHWLKPLKVIGIPFSVAVKNGKVIWSGHPIRLSTDLVRSMTRADFTTHVSRKSPKQREAEARRRVNEISHLFSLGKTEDAEQALHALIADDDVPASQKIAALEEPCSRALRAGEFRKMNAALRRQAETLPRSFQNLIRVLNFILTTDDIPPEERDYALAIECIQKADALCSDMPGQRSFLQTRLGEIYEARGNTEEAQAAHQTAWELSPEFAYLKNLREKLSGKGGNAEALALFDALESGEKSLPAEFFAIEEKRANASEKAATTHLRKESETPEAKDFVKFFESLEWIQGEAPKSLPANGLLFVDIWNPPPPGPHNSLLSRAPAEWLDGHLKNVSSAETIVIAIEHPAGRAAKALSFPRNRTPHAVAAVPRNTVDENFFKRFKLTELPASVAIRDGQVIWSGSAQELPEWLVQEAVKPDYDHAAAEKLREEEQRHFSRTTKILSKARDLAGKAKFSEAKAIIDAARADIDKHPMLDMLAAEILVSEPFARGNYAEVGRICENILKKYPKTAYIAEHQTKILNANPELREVTLPVSVLACKNIIESGTPYVSAYWTIIAKLYEEIGDFENAVRAAFAARETSDKYRRTKKP